ncbi:hypothetical protein ABE488_14450 [Luteimonas sp. TWI662]
MRMLGSPVIAHALARNGTLFGLTLACLAAARPVLQRPQARSHAFLLD